MLATYLDPEDGRVVDRRRRVGSLAGVGAGVAFVQPLEHQHLRQKIV